MFYLYDPRTNISTPTNYQELQGITGLTVSVFSNAKRQGRKIRPINCYITNGVASLKQRQAWYAAEVYPDESWLPLHDTIGTYFVSNYGRVKRVYKTTERILLPFRVKGQGNLFVKIDGVGIKIGHLVARVYLRKPNPEERIVRKNGIITDDYVSNLEIVTLSELGKRTGFKSKSLPVLKIDAETGETIDEYRSAREAGRENYFSYQAILDKCNGESKQSGPYIWKFERDCEPGNELGGGFI
ncbi:hypothetical protein SporoP37_00320 [Sporosarcina sp. P37]|uniref:NUMOD4 domain-containing protein n=1 Tax=unclassified Sporosarcina TaxID=2647733 RepID=UPI000A17E26E|nr:MULTISPECIES: NUMOD4 domain-containing protein [unclassified Sporosarcina]ARK23285.1 hypothetical protein SporoP37_00320 [Sporosarcina sp. P37]PID19536.1 hypothetical protein CSV62_03270 [Sporosarcina sp. P35]